MSSIQPKVPCKGRRSAWHLLLLLMIVAPIFGVEGDNWTFKKSEGEELIGTVAIQQKVSSRLRCAAIAKSLSSEGYTLTHDTSSCDGQVTCSVYSSITGKTQNAGATSYLTNSGTYLARGAVEHNGNWYLVNQAGAPGKTYAEMLQWCSDNGGSPFMPTSSADWTFMAQVHSSHSYGHTWVPITDIDAEGVLKWIDGRSVTETNIPWQSNTYAFSNSDDEDCVTGHLSGESLDVHMYPCTSAYKGFFCEIP